MAACVPLDLAMTGFLYLVSAPADTVVQILSCRCYFIKPFYCRFFLKVASRVFSSEVPKWNGLLLWSLQLNIT